MLTIYFFTSSRPEVFCKKDVLGNFAKFTGKHLYQSLFLNKVAGLCQSFFNKGATLLKKRLWRRCFPVNLAKFLRTPFYRHTIKPRTPEHGTTEHGTLADHRNSGGTPTEHRNNGATLEHWRNNG